jgi:hypothetical protein
VPDEIDRKLQIYSAYLGFKKAEYTRMLLTRELSRIENDFIPSNLIKKAEGREENRE